MERKLLGNNLASGFGELLLHLQADSVAKSRKNATINPQSNLNEQLIKIMPNDIENELSLFP